MNERNKGFLMTNPGHKDGDGRPEYTGRLTANGVEFLVSAWMRKTDTGFEHLSLSLEMMEYQRLSPAAVERARIQAQRDRGMMERHEAVQNETGSF